MAEESSASGSAATTPGIKRGSSGAEAERERLAIALAAVRSRFGTEAKSIDPGTAASQDRLTQADDRARQGMLRGTDAILGRLEDGIAAERLAMKSLFCRLTDPVT